MTDQARGVVAILTDKNGQVIKAASDFGSHAHEAVSLEKARQKRARYEVARKAIEELSDPRLSASLDWEMRDLILELMIHKGGFQLTFLPVYEEEAG